METPQGGSGSGPERDKSNTPSSSPISVVSAFWKDFDLEKEKSVLDEQGLRIAENQENSQKNRRKLAENTRDFKKASPEEKLSLFNTLLKGYQEELYEAPDPYPALASVAEQDLKLSELESENRKMKVELEEFRTEATHLKNQQATIRRLEERNRQLEQQMEEKVKEIVEIKQRSLAEENQKTMEVLKESTPTLPRWSIKRREEKHGPYEPNKQFGFKKLPAHVAGDLFILCREQALQDQLQHAKESVANMQKLHELAQNQLFELRAQSEEERAAKQSEVSLLMDEVERAQTMLLSLERQKGVLQSQLQTANEETEVKKSDNLDSNNALENSLNAKEKQISELNMELHSIETTLSNEREEHINEVKKLTARLNEKNTADQRQVSLDQDQSSMLKVICNQRDRFRARLRETEEEIRQLKEKIGVLTVELEKTKADNVKLYGKIRYVQDYNHEKVVSRGSKKYVEDVESGFSSDVESKYKKIYEDDINPFAAFSKKERDQRYKELGFRDRITLSSGRFLLGNKYA
ncbi:CASP, C-terminal [Sesbania bispinosa]|nr:CASP, C-terminal [Sesbania bispinosa]